MKVLIVGLSGLVVGIAILLLVQVYQEDPPSETLLVEAVPPTEEKLVKAPERANMEFDDAPLSEVVRVFNKSNATQIELADPAMGEMKITASLRSGNPDVFVSLLELTFDLRVEHVDESKIVLYRKEAL